MHPVLLHSLLVFIFTPDLAVAQSPTIPRWGQAASLVQDTLFIHGGRTDQYNSYAYSSAPVSNDLFSLSLSSSFDLSSPPWQYFTGCSSCAALSGPAVACHTLSAFNSSNLFLFGGDPGPNSPIVLPEKADSAAYLNINDRQSPGWDLMTQSWANQPLRRAYHTASSTGGKIWLIGGLKTDGSNVAFSDHYVFDPNIPSFTQLPTTNGPPDIYGHTSLVLSNGLLLVFGGFSPSQNILFGFDVIWALDTTKSSLSWTLLSISNSSLPTPRRGFAATVLSVDKILIQGGGDSTLQTTFGDGWILDTSKNPMVWSSVEPLSLIGPRIDHFAMSVGSTVLFGFGYSGSGAANSSLLVFDTITSVFVSSYEPPSPQTFSSITTLLPSPTSSPPSSHPSQHSASVSATSSNPSSTNSDDPSSSSNATNPHTTVIALGAVFGVVALLAGTTVLTWYMRRHPRGSQESFHLLSPSPDDDSPHMGRIIPIVGAGTTGSTGTREKGGPPITKTVRDKFYSFVGGRFGTQQGRRRDMLADEDTRQFDAEFGAGWWGSSHGRDGSGSGAGLRRGTSSGQSSWRSVMRPATLTDRVHDSFVSLRNVGGAMLGYTAGTSGSGGRREANASGGSRSTRWRAEKEPSDPFGDKYGVNKPLPSPSSPPPSPRPRGSRQGSSFGYQDPFQDYEVEPFNYDYDSRRGYIRRGSEEIDEDGYPALLDPPPKPHLPAKVPASHPSSAIAVDITYLSPVSEHPSLSTLSDSNNIINLNTPSDSSHTSLLHTLGTSATFENTQTSSSPSQSLDTPRSPQKRPSSIIDANPPPSLLTMGSIRRSGSWWTRFAKTPLLDRRLSSTSRTSHGPIEIRDPNPLPPRLVPIKESSGSSPESSHIQSNSHPRNESGGDLEGGDDLFGQGNRKRGGHAQIYSSHLHGRSASSFQTSKTANSEMLERVGRTLDIVQRGSYYSDRSHSLSTEGRRMSSTGSGLGLEDDEGIPPVPPLSIVTSATAAMSSQTHSNRLSAGGSILNESGTLVQSPEDSVGGEMETTIKGRPSSGYGYSHPSIGLISSRRSSPSPTQPLLPLPPPSSYSPPPRRKSPKTGQGNVASRIQAFERRMSQESPQSGSSPQSQILSFQKRKEERPKSPLSPGTKTRSRGASVYGVVPKPELFVANPDLRERSSSG